MKFLNHIRSKSKARNTDDPPTNLHSRPNSLSSAASASPNPTARFPARLVQHLLSFVCPHALDDTYTPCEESMVDGGCMLCDMRDLAQCTLVNRHWAEATQSLLYRHVRIDAVHYCDREADLTAVRRKRKSFSGRAGHRDPPQERLQLFARTVRDNQVLADRVRSLKLPYMTRETCKAELARTVSVLRNLQYVDLPDGFCSDDPSTNTLKQELQSRCPDIRKMKYAGGAERSFAMVAEEKQWPNLEILELHRLEIDAITLTDVLATLTSLRELGLVDLPSLDDNALLSASAASFPPLTSLSLRDAANISADGLVVYLSRLDVCHTLTSLALSNTSILPSTLHQILLSLPELTKLYVSETVCRPFPISSIPPLTSNTLRSLNYEISNSGPFQTSLTSPSESYYAYLARSILNNSLPSLNHLYALSTTLPTLLVPSTNPPSSSPPTTTTTGPTTPLNLYTKSLSELEWDFTLITPPTGSDRRGSKTDTRPMSLYHAPPPLSPQWRDKGRESVMVGNGFGGFLMVPGEETRGVGSRGKPPKRERDAWMG